ncbi:MAG: hypothetical protein M3286_01740 [Thermoproteota archaeon]|nr:hypothetical protein [Thermoproteota archaeon]
MSTADRNFTDPERLGIDSKSKRIDDVMDEPPTNEAMDSNKASKLANLLEGLKFPATKEKIKNHLNTRSSNIVNRIDDVVEAIENNLEEGKEYSSAYNVEVAAGLVKKKTESERPYSRDIGLNRANRERVGESERQDPYGIRETISSASPKDVSPNTPKGEDV